MTEDTFESLLVEALQLARTGWARNTAYCVDWREKEKAQKAILAIVVRAADVPT